MKRVTPDEAADFFEKFADDLEYSAHAAIAWGQEEVLEEARILSSGPYTAADLRRMGHPFAKRHLLRHPKSAGGRYAWAPGKPKVETSIINIQRDRPTAGQFAAGWQANPVEAQGDDYYGAVVNTDEPVATFLAGGTPTMVARPIVARIVSDVGRRVESGVLSRLAQELKARTRV